VTRVAWQPILERAAEIVESYSTRVTLRQLHYRLVSEPELGYRNVQGHYTRLSHLTAQLRREGAFPALADLTREIVEYRSEESPADALKRLAYGYRRDRTEGQDIVPVIIAEKATLSEQLSSWFAKPYGIPVVPLRGYSSESLERDIADRFDDGGDYVVLYVGDHDPSGVDIEESIAGFVGDYFVDWRRVAVTPALVDEYHLPEAPGKASDTRAGAFVARYGKLVQVEVEALDPNALRQLLSDAVADYWDDDAYTAVLEREKGEVARLHEIAWEFRGEGGE
jgi:hypothetical protein